LEVCGQRQNITQPGIDSLGRDRYLPADSNPPQQRTIQTHHQILVTPARDSARKSANLNLEGEEIMILPALIHSAVCSQPAGYLPAKMLWSS